MRLRSAPRVMLRLSAIRDEKLQVDQVEADARRILSLRRERRPAP